MTDEPDTREETLAFQRLRDFDYLGDGVYAEFDGYQIWLKTDGPFHENRIALEPAVLDALDKYVARLRQKYQSKPPEETT